MKLDFNFSIKGLDGTDLPDTNAGKLLGNVLAAATQGDAFKYYEWAKAVYNGVELDLDTSDTETLKKFIKDSNFAVIVKAQLMEVFL